jgi:SAM-dependent methyltransferase
VASADDGMTHSTGTAGGGRGRLFDAIATEYDEMRPDYPEGLYVAIESMTGPLAGKDVVDLAAGPGTATRQLRARGANVVAVDPGLPMIARLRARTGDATAVVGRAEQLPLRDQVADLVCCATAWHWMAVEAALAEVRRVVRPGGHLALWWANNMRDDQISWERTQAAVYRRWEIVGGSRPPGVVGVGPRDAARHLRRRGLDVVIDTELRWTRVVPTEVHLRVLATHSVVLALGSAGQQFLDEVAAALSPWQQVVERLWGPLVVARIG